MHELLRTLRLLITKEMFFERLRFLLRDVIGVSDFIIEFFLVNVILDNFIIVFTPLLVYHNVQNIGELYSELYRLLKKLSTSYFLRSS